jgi:hypothetical protein
MFIQRPNAQLDTLSFGQGPLTLRAGSRIDRSCRCYARRSLQMLTRSSVDDAVDLLRCREHIAPADQILTAHLSKASISITPTL